MPKKFSLVLFVINATFTTLTNTPSTTYRGTKWIQYHLQRLTHIEIRAKRGNDLGPVPHRQFLQNEIFRFGGLFKVTTF